MKTALKSSDPNRANLSPVPYRFGLPQAVTLSLHATIAKLQERVETQAEVISRLSKRMNHDELTGTMLNSRGLAGAVQHAMGNHRRYGHAATLLVIKLDGLADVAAAIGHQAAQAFILHAAVLLRRNTHMSDPVAHFAPGEFAVLLEGATMAEALGKARRLRHALSRSKFIWKGKAMPFAPALGLAGLNERETPQQVVELAQTRVLRLKAALKPLK
jgi:diguanylate cyclase